MNTRRVAFTAATLLLLALTAGWLHAQQATPADPESPAMPEQVRAAIAAGLADPNHAENTGKLIPEGAAPGVFGIAGAPNPSYVLGFLWAIWVGWIFSTVGAFGGIMAGVGHITIFGFGDYARSFGKGHPLNTLLTDSIRVSNQWLVGPVSYTHLRAHET